MRWVCRIEAVELESAGTKIPDSRNCLMFDIRRREEAEGESRIMGSRRRPAVGFLRLETRALFVVMEDVVGAEREVRPLPR